MLYIGREWEANPKEAVLTDSIYDLGSDAIEEDILDFIADELDGIRISSDPGSVSKGAKEHRWKPDTLIDWVSREMDEERGCVSQAYCRYGNEASVANIYGRVCVIVALGPHGDRLNVDEIDCKKPINESTQQRYGAYDYDDY